MAIISFGDKVTKDFFEEGVLSRNAGWAYAESIVKRKLDMIHYASTLIDLRSPPGNRLEALKGNYLGYCSIRVNDRWRIVFKWNKNHNYAEEVRVCDYH